MIGSNSLHYNINFTLFEILRVIFEENCCVTATETHVWGIDAIRFFNLVVMYRSSGAYHNSRAAGYTAGSGRSNDYSAKPVSSTSSVYSYKPSSSSIQSGTSTTASLTGSRSPSASYITTGANRSSGELSSVNRDADPSR